MTLNPERVTSSSPHLGQAQVVHLGKIEGNCVFFSDVHLMQPFDFHTAHFLKVLMEAGNSAQHVFLLGDVFEFIDASQRFFRKLWKPVFDTLTELRNQGVHVYFLEGNHDFGFELSHRREFKKTESWLRSWSTFAADAAFEFEHPGAGLVHVRHGDDVVTHDAYLRFRHFAKSFPAQFALSLLPALPIHLFFLWFSKKSRRRGEAYVLTSQKLLLDFEVFLQTRHFRKPNVLIVGHIHVLGDGYVKGVRTLSGPDWHTAPSILELAADGKITRRFLNLSGNTQTK